jgi:hypothetical protein
MNRAERERSLLALVAEYRDQECRRILDDAGRRAAKLIHDTYGRQRDALHRRVVAERSRAVGLIQAARAEAATRERRRSEAIDSTMIALAWPRLRAALAARWADPQGRRGWVESALGQALRRLPPGDWCIRHPGDWPAAEQDRLAEAVRAHAGVPPDLLADPGIDAGLVIASGNALLDATLDGLLRDREQVRARLLALWHGNGDDPDPSGSTGIGDRP